MTTEAEARAFLELHYGRHPGWKIVELDLKLLIPTTDPEGWSDIVRGALSDAGWDIQVVELGPSPRQIIRTRGRQSGKTHEMAQHAARASGLTVETCEELLRSGYSFTAYKDRPNEWVQSGRRR